MPEEPELLASGTAPRPLRFEVRRDPGLADMMKGGLAGVAACLSRLDNAHHSGSVGGDEDDNGLGPQMHRHTEFSRNSSWSCWLKLHWTRKKGQ
jgi:hypothetical protein